MDIVEPEELKEAIVAALKRQGFRIRKGVVSLPKNPTKDVFRKMNELAVAKKREVASKGLKRHEADLIQYIANGSEVTPHSVHPKIVLVKPDSEYELLFRYACLHWSIPVSSGYGRRLRFLVLDESNNKLIGVLGLGDPVFALKARDTWIGWDSAAKRDNLYHVMDAYALGAVPPYSSLICGKLVAMLACSNEVRKAFRAKYSGQESLIRKEVRKPYLALLTTTSALGRSSIYNRLRIGDHAYWSSVGFTQGSGDFHFSNGVYGSMRTYVETNCDATAKHSDWGEGFRNRREVIRKCLSSLDLSADWIYHGIRREVFVAPLGRDTLRFLCGDVSRPVFYDWPAATLAEMFLKRWLIPRSERVPEYREFDREQYRLWP